MFENILGDRRPKKILEGFIKNGLPQAMIFTGLAQGKKEVALQISKHVLRDAYNVDMLLIDSQPVKIDDIRNAIRFLNRKAFFGKKFLIIDVVSTITPEAQDAFLKALEETFQGNHIIIIVDVPEKLFSTIRSRCVEVKFGFSYGITQPATQTNDKKSIALNRIDELIIEARNKANYDRIWELHSLRKNILRNANPDYQLAII